MAYSTIANAGPPPLKDLLFTSNRRVQLLWKWTVPGGSVRPGQSVVWLKQASLPRPVRKNQFNIGARRCLACQILSWQEQILHMILAKRPRSDAFEINQWQPTTKPELPTDRHQCCNVCSTTHGFADINKLLFVMYIPSKMSDLLSLTQVELMELLVYA